MTTILDILNDLAEDIRIVYEGQETYNAKKARECEEFAEEAEHKIADLLARIQR